MIAFDSSLIVPAFATWHAAHPRALRALQHALESKAGVVVPAHALIESFAVLTRLPAPHRMAPVDVLTMLKNTFGSTRIVALSSRSVWPLLERLTSLDLGGGITYDALILETAIDAGADELLTLNERDYDRLEPRLRVVGV